MSEQELRGKLVEILASCLSDNDVKPRTEEVFDAFKEAGWRPLKGLSEWVIIIKRKLQEKKNEHNGIKPHDIQALAVLGGKIKALQQVIDKLKSMELV